MLFKGVGVQKDTQMPKTMPLPTSDTAAPVPEPSPELEFSLEDTLFILQKEKEGH